MRDAGQSMRRDDGQLGKERGKLRRWLPEAQEQRRIVDRNRRIDAPASVTPQDVPSAEDAQRLLEESRAMLRSAIAEADGLALGLIMHPHPVVGEINLYEWILFVGLHEQRHLPQIGEVAAAPAN